MEKFPLDIILEEGDVYETGKREALVIRKIGTNAATETSPTNLWIDEKPLGKITQTLSPISKVNTLFMDLLDLGHLFYVVPPETEVIVEGPSGLEIRCVGELLKLAVGETLPTDLMARFKAQPNHYMTFLYGYVDWSAGKTFAADEEIEVISYTPKTIERIAVYGPLQAKLVGWTRAMHEVAVRFYLENVPYDLILEKTKIGGIDLYNTPYPPTETTEHNGYVMPKGFIEVPGDHTLKIKQRNISGADITIAAATGNGPYVCCAIEYQTGV